MALPLAIGLLAGCFGYSAYHAKTLYAFVQSSYLERAPQAFRIAEVNRLILICSILTSALSPLATENLFGGIVTTLVAVPIILLDILLYVIFSDVRQRAQEVLVANN